MSPTAAGLCTADSIEAMEVDRCAAMTSGDGERLRKIFSEDATWIHSSGHVDDRESFIAKIESGASSYLSIERTETTMRMIGDAAIASGVATMTALADGQPRSLRNRYVNVWGARDGRLVLVSAQSTKLV